MFAQLHVLNMYLLQMFNSNIAHLIQIVVAVALSYGYLSKYLLYPFYFIIYLLLLQCCIYYNLQYKLITYLYYDLINTINIIYTIL